MRTESKYQKNQYRITHGLVFRPFVEKDAEGKFLRSDDGQFIRVMRETTKPAAELSNEEICRCPHCGSEAIVHNRGTLVPPHLEHKRLADAQDRNCPALKPDFKASTSNDAA